MSFIASDETPLSLMIKLECLLDNFTLLIDNLSSNTKLVSIKLPNKPKLPNEPMFDVPF